MNTVYIKRAKRNPQKQPRNNSPHLSDDCLGNVLQFLPIYTLLRILCVSSQIKEKSQKALSRLTKLPCDYLFTSKDILFRVQSLKKHCQRLQSIDLGVYGQNFQNTIEKLVLSFPHLKRLCYDTTRCPSDQFITDVSLMLPKLEALKITLRCLPARPVSLNLVRCKNLKTFYIMDGKVAEEDAGVFLRENVTLQKLTFLCVNLNLANAFAAAGILPNLKNLEIWPCREPIGLRTVQSIVHSMPNLEIIDLDGCCFDSTGLTELMELKNIVSLRLKGANLREFPIGFVKVSMKTFVAIRSGMDDSCIARIARAFPNLKELNVGTNSTVTKAALKQNGLLGITVNGMNMK